MLEPAPRLSPPLVALLSEHGQLERYAANDVLFHEGDASTGLYLLLSGRLKVHATAADGREVTYNLLEPGELVGELSMDGSARTASVRALTDVTCILVDNRTARTLLRTQPDLAEHVLSLAALRARRSTHMTRSMALESTRDRVLGLLERHAIADGDVWRVPTELTQQEIANRIGASRETVNRAIGALVREGIVRKDAGQRMSLLAMARRRTG